MNRFVTLYSIEVVAQIFESLDQDGNEQLDYLELKSGLESHDVVISADEFRKLVALVDHNHKGDVTLPMFHRLMEMTGTTSTYCAHQLWQPCCHSIRG